MIFYRRIRCWERDSSQIEIEPLEQSTENPEKSIFRSKEDEKKTADNWSDLRDFLGVKSNLRDKIDKRESIESCHRHQAT